MEVVKGLDFGFAIGTGGRKIGVILVCNVPYWEQIVLELKHCCGMRGTSDDSAEDGPIDGASSSFCPVIDLFDMVEYDGSSLCFDNFSFVFVGHCTGGKMEMDSCRGKERSFEVVPSVVQHVFVC